MTTLHKIIDWDWITDWECSDHNLHADTLYFEWNKVRNGERFWKHKEVNKYTFKVLYMQNKET